MFNMRIYGTHCGPLEILGGPLLVHLNLVEYNWSKMFLEGCSNVRSNNNATVYFITFYV